MLTFRSLSAVFLMGFTLAAMAAQAAGKAAPARELKSEEVLTPRENALRCFMAGTDSLDDPVRSAEYFLAAAFADAENCEVPLNYLLRLPLSRAQTAKLLPDYDEFWQKHQDNLKLLKYGIALHKFARKLELPEQLLPVIAAGLEKKKELNPDEKAALGEIVAFQLENLGRQLKFAEADKLIERFLPQTGYGYALYTSLLYYYRRAAFQLEGYEKPNRRWFSSEKKYQKCFIDTLQFIRQQNDRDPGFFVALGFPEFPAWDTEQLYRLEPGRLHLVSFCHFASMLPEKEYLKRLERNRVSGKKHSQLFDARNAYFNGKYEKALALFTPEVMAAPNPLIARYFRLLCLEQIRPQQAAAELAQLKKGDPLYDESVLILLQCAVELKDEKIFRRCAALINKMPRTPLMANQLAYSALLLNADYPEAEKLLDYALQEEPDNAAFADSKGYLLLLRGRADEALRFFIKALKMADGSFDAAEIFYHIALAQEALKRPKEAAAACRLAKAFYLRAGANAEPSGLRFRQEMEASLQRMEKSAAKAAAEEAAKKAAEAAKKAGQAANKERK